jgi:hypothetical protein
MATATASGDAVSDDEQQGDVVVPFEFKSGRFHHSHAAQVCGYVCLHADEVADCHAWDYTAIE